MWADSPRRARGTSILPWCQGERAHRARKALAAWDGGVSVTVTWSPAPATERLPAVLQRALAATGHTIASFPAGIAVATIRCLLDRRQRAHPVASSLRRQLASVTRELPGQTGPHEGVILVIQDLTVSPGYSPDPKSEHLFRR